MEENYFPFLDTIKKYIAELPFSKRQKYRRESHIISFGQCRAFSKETKAPSDKQQLYCNYPQGFGETPVISCSYYLLLTATGRRVNGTKHNKHRQGLKYLIKCVHTETWNTKQHINANKTTIYTHAKKTKTKITTDEDLFFFMYLKWLRKILNTARYDEVWTMPQIG